MARRLTNPDGSKAWTARETSFFNAFKLCGNLTEAALAAGCAPNSANRRGYELRHRPHIAAAIEAWQAETAEEADITAQDVVRGLHKEATLTGEGSTQTGRVTAWMGIAKVLGYEKLSLVGDPNNPIVHVIRRVIVDPKSDGPRG